MSDTQPISMQFAPDAAQHAGHHPLGAPVRQRRHHRNPHRATDGPETWCTAKFSYYGVAVTAYAHIPAAPASS